MILKLVVKIIFFIFLTTLLAEFLVNRQSSTLFLLLFIVCEMAVFLILFYKHIKTLLK